MRSGCHQPCFTLPLPCLQMTFLPLCMSSLHSQKNCPERSRTYFNCLSVVIKLAVGAEDLKLIHPVLAASGSIFPFKPSYFPVKFLDSPSFLSSEPITCQLFAGRLFQLCFLSLPFGLRLLHSLFYTLLCVRIISAEFMSPRRSLSLPSTQP